VTSEITLFVNPTAGRGRGAHAAQPAARALREAGFSVRTVLGEDADDALRRAREAVAGGTGALIAVGGDGMVSLALQAVAGTRTPLGVVAVGNGSSYGGGMRICAGARMDDGLFDVTVVGDCTRTTLLTVFPKVYKGTHLSHPKVTVYRLRTITLEAAGVTGYADGDPMGALPLTARCVPGAVRVLAQAPVPLPAPVLAPVN
jgi:diacylglycerol kinase family enzyme